MPTVEKVGGGRVNVRGAGEYRRGEQYDVDDDTAEYLVEERGDFAYIDEDEGGDAEAEDDGEGYLRDQPPDVQIDEGVCPWCPPDDRYEGENVGQHASRAHPDEWTAYKEA